MNPATRPNNPPVGQDKKRLTTHPPCRLSSFYRSSGRMARGYLPPSGRTVE